MEYFQWAAFSCRGEVEELAAGLLESPTEQLSAGIKSRTDLVCQEKPCGLWAAPINANVVLSREAELQPARFRAGCWESLALGVRGRELGTLRLKSAAWQPRLTTGIPPTTSNLGNS